MHEWVGSEINIKERTLGSFERNFYYAGSKEIYKFRRVWFAIRVFAVFLVNIIKTKA